MSNTMIFEKNVLRKKRRFFFEFFPLFKGPGRARMGPYGPEKSKTIRKQIAFIGALKMPCTLP